MKAHVKGIGRYLDCYTGRRTCVAAVEFVLHEDVEVRTRKRIFKFKSGKTVTVIVSLNEKARKADKLAPYSGGGVQGYFIRANSYEEALDTWFVELAKRADGLPEGNLMHFLRPGGYPASMQPLSARILSAQKPVIEYRRKKPKEKTE